MGGKFFFFFFFSKTPYFFPLNKPTLPLWIPIAAKANYSAATVTIQSKDLGKGSPALHRLGYRSKITNLII